MSLMCCSFTLMYMSYIHMYIHIIRFIMNITIIIIIYLDAHKGGVSAFSEFYHLKVGQNVW